MNFSFKRLQSKLAAEVRQGKIVLSHASLFSNIPVLFRTVVKIEKKGNFPPFFPLKILLENKFRVANKTKSVGRRSLTWVELL